MTASPTAVPSPATIQSRLPYIFPEGVENRTYLIRDIAVRTIFVMFYTGAIESSGTWIRPDQVTKMSDSQSHETGIAERERWVRESLRPGKMKHVEGRWYAVNTREPIRDETLRAGLVAVGAVIERGDLPTTSSKPRYALSREFASLFDERLDSTAFMEQAQRWQNAHLSASALMRIQLRHRGAAAAGGSSPILVRLPNGETRLMKPGPSSVLSKAVIEEFAPRFLVGPALIFLSESGNKVVEQDDRLARKIGLQIQADRNLPDIILADIGINTPILVFIEVVITDGAITRSRKEALSAIVAGAGIPEDRTAYLTAFADRGLPEFRRLSSELAWGSTAWFASEPDHLLLMQEGIATLETIVSLPLRR